MIFNSKIYHIDIYSSKHHSTYSPYYTSSIDSITLILSYSLFTSIIKLINHILNFHLRFPQLRGSIDVRNMFIRLQYVIVNLLLFIDDHTQCITHEPTRTSHTNIHIYTDLSRPRFLRRYYMHITHEMQDRDSISPVY